MIAEKLSSMCTTDSSKPFVLPVDSAPKESLFVNLAIVREENEEKAGKSVDEEMAKSARRTLERLLLRKTDATIHNE